MALYFCNFAYGEKYLEVQKKQCELLSPFCRDIFEYGDDFLKSVNFYEDNKSLFEDDAANGTVPTGNGWCSWKPLIIKHTLQQLTEQDFLIYMDVSDYIYNNYFYQWLQFCLPRLDYRLFNINYYRHGDWCRRDTMIMMGCDEEKYWNARQLEAGLVGLSKTQENLDFLDEWYSWCQNKQAITKVPNIYGENLEGFKDHRCDQAILTNLFYKRNWPGEFMENIRAYIAYNYFEQGWDLKKHQY